MPPSKSAGGATLLIHAIDGEGDCAMKSIKFAKWTTQEAEIVHKVIQRANSLFSSPVDALSLEMDLAATHAYIPLDLQQLLDADDFNFIHDVLGIMRHINRRTGELEDHFMPRFSRFSGDADSLN